MALLQPCGQQLQAATRKSAMRRVVVSFHCLLLSLCCLAATSHASEHPHMVYKDEVAFFAKLKQGGSVALMRHALAPGGGDPENFALNQRETQRNLSQAGRDQATAIGERFRANGIKQARVFTSQWYRCRDTAELLGLGPVTQLPALNSFFRRPADREPNLRSLKHWLATADLRQPTILVTHQVTITAMSDIFPASGEIILLHKQDGNWVVADRFLVEP